MSEKKLWIPIDSNTSIFVLPNGVIVKCYDTCDSESCSDFPDSVGIAISMVFVPGAKREDFGEEYQFQNQDVDWE